MICEVCKKNGFVYERKIIDEAFFLCEECDWSTEDIEIANKIGEMLVEIINNKREKQ